MREPRDHEVFGLALAMVGLALVGYVLLYALM